jgi:hypothetical protein
MITPDQTDQPARTLPAAKTLMIAIQQAEAIYKRTLNDILGAAIEDNPELKDASLDTGTGLWTLP